MTERHAENGSDNVLLAAALLGQTGAPVGPPPSQQELRDWARQRLEPARQTQIDSHLAHDPALLALAVRLLDLGATPKTRRVWRAPLALAAAAAIVATGLALQVSWRPSDGTSTGAVSVAQDQVFRSARQPHADWRVEAFRQGFARARGRTIAAPVAPNLAVCLDGAACAGHVDTLADFGAWVARIEANCSATPVPASDHTVATDPAQALRRRMAGSVELAAWRVDLQELTAALARSPAAGCAAAVELRRERVDD